MTRHKALSLTMLVLALAVAMPGGLLAQGQQAQHIFTPMASPRAEVAQRIALTDVEVVYHRPAVNERDVWGRAVLHGFTR